MTLALAARPRTIAHLGTEIVIPATADDVWAVLTDTRRYPEWNPFIRTLTGRLVAGEHVSATIQPIGQRAMSFRPLILRADAGRELRWRGRFLHRSIFQGEHAFRLLPEASQTRLVHEETFSGLMLRFMDVESFRPSFEAMNEALKARVAHISTLTGKKGS